jgi:hypothetical protein
MRTGIYAAAVLWSGPNCRNTTIPSILTEEHIHGPETLSLLYSCAPLYALMARLACGQAICVCVRTFFLRKECESLTHCVPDITAKCEASSSWEGGGGVAACGSSLEWLAILCLL